MIGWWDTKNFDEVADLAYAELFQDGFTFDELEYDPGHAIRRIIGATLRNVHFMEIRQQRDEAIRVGAQYLDAQKERDQARADVLKLRGEWLPLSTMGHNAMTSMREGMCNEEIAKLVRKWLDDTERYEKYR